MYFVVCKYCQFWSAQNFVFGKELKELADEKMVQVIEFVFERKEITEE